jgi:predicted transcriptional regulator
VAATTVRLPDDLDERLSAYCAEVGAVKNRLVALAMREYLEDDPPPRVALAPREPAALEAAAEGS